MKSKKLKNTAVPKLRFPEFRDSGEWKEYRLNQISEHIDKRVCNLQLITVSITAGVGFVTQVEKFGRDISGEQYKNYIELNIGEFAYNKGYSKKYPQGCIYKLKEFKRVAVPNAFICFRLAKNFVADFFQGYFDNNYHGKQLQKFITSGARSDGLLNVNFNDFFKIILPIPFQKKEQQKIADCLSSIDALISEQSRKLEALKVHKKSLMQQLFPAEGETVPKLRFPKFRNVGEWEEKALSELAEINPKVNKLPDSFIYIDLESVENGQLLKKNRICKKDAPSRAQRLLKYGDVIYQTVRPYQKNNFYFDFVQNDYVASTGYAQLRAYDNSKFLFQYIHTDSFVNNVLLKCTGTNYPAINTFNISQVTGFVPSASAEQQKIADCLSSIDELISVQSRKLETLKTHKKGLMQQLFPTMSDFARRASISIENKITNNKKISVGDSHQ
jgi:type I restriction enzyme S subunit